MGASVHLQPIAPAGFSGHDAFVDRMASLADLCHADPPIDPGRPVRLPGEQADRTVAALRAHAARLGVDAGMLD